MNILFSRIKSRWYGDGGYREVLIIALPLIISTGAWSVQHFVDRMFLAWYSPEAIAAAMPAGMLSFTISCIFIGSAGYVSTFVAQYYGARRCERCGPSMWQGIYLAFIGGAIQAMMIPMAGSIMAFIGHDPAIQDCERVYFIILCYGATPAIASSAISAFFSGLGKTRIVMWVTVSETGVNLFLDWLLIFGRWGFPEMGIAGAGIATVAAFCYSVVIFFILIVRFRYHQTYVLLSGWRFDRSLFWRLVRFGFPSGMQLFIDIAGFTVFILLIGKIGLIQLAASNIAFNINTLAFMPMIGAGIAVSVLVGQRLGENRPEIAERSTYSAFHLAGFYIVLIVFLYIVLPDLFITPFIIHSNFELFEPIRGVTRTLLRFLAVYSLFDAMSIIFAASIKGAGDTRFVMMTMALLSVFGLIIPCYAAFMWFSLGLYAGWTFASAYIILLGIIFHLRFRGGKWKDMRVIEESPGCVSSENSGKHCE